MKVTGLSDMTLKTEVPVGVGTLKKPHYNVSVYHARIKICVTSPKAVEEKFLNGTFIKQHITKKRHRAGHILGVNYEIDDFFQCLNFQGALTGLSLPLNVSPKFL